MKKLFYLFFLLLCFSFSLHAEQITFNNFSGGLHDDIEADLIDINESPDCQNVIINYKGNSLQKRKGFDHYKTLTDSDTYACSNMALWRDLSTGQDFFIVAHGTVTSKVSEDVNSDFASGFTDGKRTDFTFNEEFIYGCNGIDQNWYYDGATYTQFAATEPKTFTHAFYQDRYFLANTSGSPDEVWQSYYNQPTNLHDTIDFDNPGDAADNYKIGASGEQILKLIPYAGGLMVMKTKSLHKIIGNETPFDIKEITHDLGLMDPGSVREYQGILYFLGDDRVYYAYDGSVLTPLSEKIKKTTDKIVSNFGGDYVASVWSLDSFDDFIVDATKTQTYIDRDGYVKLLTDVQLLDDFADSNYTTNPTWEVWETPRAGAAGTGIFEISDYAARLSATGVTGGVNRYIYFSSTTCSEYDGDFITNIKFANTNLKSGCNYFIRPIYVDSKIELTLTFYKSGSDFKVSISARNYTDSGSSAGVTINPTFGWDELRLNMDSGTYILYYNDAEIINFASSVVITSNTYVQLEHSIQGQSSDTTPYLTNIRIPTSTATVYGGDYISAIKDLSSSYTWGTQTNTESQDANTNINYYYRTNASSVTITGDAWTLVANNALISATEAQYVQWRSSMTTTTTASIPNVDKMISNYFDTTSTEYKSGSISFFKDRMYCSIDNIDISGNDNDYVLVYDLINNSWFPYKGLYATNFVRKDNDLYFAESRYGTILKESTNSYFDYDSSDSSDVAIDAYWYTRQDYLENPF